MKRKSINDLARAAGMRVVPMIGDPEAYRRALDYFVVGWAKGYRTAQRRFKGPRGNLTTCDMD